MENTINEMWMVIAAILVFLMQAGFALLETGLVRAKNTINISLKNMLDVTIAGLAFWVIGYGIMFGESYIGLFGGNHFFFSSDEYAFFFFQLVFAGTAATIVSGAVAERMSFKGYGLVSLAVSMLIYPIFGHWAWNENGWLQNLGFIDFAGSTVVHVIGGMVGLIGTIYLGPRIGRFDECGNPTKIAPYNLTLATLGVFILWFGWFGFNGGSTLEAGVAVSKIITNTFLAASASAGAVTLLMTYTRDVIAVEKVLNGILSGLVGITAGCSVVEPSGAIAIGAISGLLVFFLDDLLLKYKVDDPVGAISVHAGAGIFGTIALVFFANIDLLPTGSRVEQLGVQITGVVTAICWTAASAWVCIKILDKFLPLRVSAEDEELGLNLVEHGAKMSWYETITTIKTIVENGDLSKRAHVESGTEDGEVANAFNKMLDDLQQKVMILKDVSNGNFEQKIITPRSDDDILSISIAMMVESLKKMMEELKDKTKELEIFNTRLEKDVKDRTHELEQKNHSLELTIKDLNEARNQLIESEKMAQLGSLVAGIAHEINTPVGIGVTASTHFIAECKEFKHLYDEQKMKKSDLELFIKNSLESSEIIFNNLNRASKLINSFKQIAVDQSNDSLREFDVKDYLNEIINSLNPEIKKRKITVSTTCPEHLIISSYPGEFAQIITNFVTNSLMHGFEQNDTGQIDIDIKDDNDFIVLNYKDTGKGIPQEHIEKIFNPFFTTKRGQGGSGLGLHLIYNLITQKFKGSIQCTSEISKGVFFVVRIPKRDSNTPTI